jgi:large subunit ribosomal protein L6
MSRVGKYPVVIPSGVTVTMAGKTVSVKGKLGELKLETTSDVETKVEDGKVWVKASSASKRSRSQWGTTRATINNMVKGVSVGYKKVLDMTGVGYKAQAQGKKLNLSLGFSHDVVYNVPEGIEVKTPAPIQI